MSFAASIVDEVNGLRGRMDSRDRRAVVDNLVFVYHMIVASGTMLDIAVCKSQPSPYRDFLIAHASEEREHAHWLRADLAKCNESIDNVELMFDAASIAGAQYYHALHTSSYCLLGYMLVLECLPMTEESVSQLEALHGSALFHTLRYHAKHDVEHGMEVLHHIDSMPKVYRELVRHNALRTVGAMARVASRFGTFPAATVSHPAHGVAELA